MRQCNHIVTERPWTGYGVERLGTRTHEARSEQAAFTGERRAERSRQAEKDPPPGPPPPTREFDFTLDLV